MTQRELRCSPIKKNLLELTSIRAFAAAAVVIYHFFYDENGNSGSIQNILADGHLGVDLFFVLSGFILTHVYLRQRLDGSFSIRYFFISRIARIYPLHAFMLLAFILLYFAADILGVKTGGEALNWAQLPYHVLLLHAWGTTDGHSWNFPSWSVSAELFAYFIFPSLLTIAIKLRVTLLLFVSIGLFLVMSEFAKLFGYTLTKMMFDYGILRVFVEFFMGISLYFFFTKYRLPAHIVKLGLILVVLSVFVLAGVQSDERLIVGMLVVLIYFLANLSQAPENNILRNPILVYLGKISFATYMVHIPVRQVFDVVASKLEMSNLLIANLAYAAAFTIIYLASVLLHHLIERPFRQYIKGWCLTVKNGA